MITATQTDAIGTIFGLVGLLHAPIKTKGKVYHKMFFF